MIMMCEKRPVTVGSQFVFLNVALALQKTETSPHRFMSPLGVKRPNLMAVASLSTPKLLASSQFERVTSGIASSSFFRQYEKGVHFVEYVDVCISSISSRAP